MSILKPDDLLKKKKDVIDKLLRDLSPDVRDLAKNILNEMSYEELLDRKKVFEILKKRGVIK